LNNREVERFESGRGKNVGAPFFHVDVAAGVDKLACTAEMPVYGETTQLAVPPMPFDYTLDFHTTDFRQHPELYRVGKGEQGVLLVQPYKSEILPHWRFRTTEVAQESSKVIYGQFLAYLKANDFVGADMARKFLQMGFTRARRYANHKGGKKYEGPVPEDKKGQSGAHGREERPRDPEDPEKAAAAAIFKAKWDQAKQHPEYLKQKAAFEERYGK
jgi:hypothetical protein